MVPHDAYSMGAIRAFRAVKTPVAKLSYLWKWLAYSRYERRGYRHFTKVVPVSNVDTAWLTALDPAIDAQTVGIPIGAEFSCDFDELPLEHQSLHIVCCGFLSQDAVAEGAIEFVTDVYPYIREKFPHVRVSMWGRNPAPRLRRSLLHFPEVRYVDYVEDYVKFLKSATIYVFPQRSGSGIQVKVQQAMALGIPVVTRSHILQSMGVKGDIHAFECDDNASMKRAILRLIDDVKLRRQIGQAGAHYVRKKYNLENIGANLEKVYLDAIAKHAYGNQGLMKQ